MCNYQPRELEDNFEQGQHWVEFQVLNSTKSKQM